MSNFDFSAFDGYNAEVEENSTLGDPATDVASEPTDDQSSFALRELISDEPILPMLQRTVRMSLVPKAAANKIDSIEGALGSFLITLCKPAGKNFKKDGQAFLQGGAPDGAGRNLNRIEFATA